MSWSFLETMVAILYFVSPDANSIEKNKKKKIHVVRGEEDQCPLVLGCLLA